MPDKSCAGVWAASTAFAGFDFGAAVWPMLATGEARMATSIAAEQAGGKCVFRPSGVKTPEESADFMSCLKARPTKLESFPQPVMQTEGDFDPAGLKSLGGNSAPAPCSAHL